ncbi:MAG: acyltransferase [Bacteroidales bacterium]|nr:acyltransferase [Bacteroidales bacterium]
MGQELQGTAGLTAPKGNKIDLIRVILTIGIVLRHAALVDMSVGTPVFDGIMKWVLLLTEVCVPLFFVISGYLFFRNVPEDPPSGWFWNKIRSRFLSLFIPLIIANCIAFGAYYLAIKQFPSMIDGFLGDRWKDPLFVFWKGPINLSLWFIRELIIVSILSPIIYLIVRHFRWCGVILLGLLWIAKIGPAPLFFFSAGACLSTWKIEPIEKWLASNGGVSVRSRAWTYFVYLYHYLLVVSIKKALVVCLSPTNTIQLIGIFLLSFVAALGILSAVYYLMRLLTPRVTRIIVGGK